MAVDAGSGPGAHDPSRPAVDDDAGVAPPLAEAAIESVGQLRDRNRRELTAAARWSFEEGLSPRVLEPEDLFDPVAAEVDA